MPRELLLDEGQHGLAEVLVVEDLVALRVDRLALLVDDVVVLDDALADVEVVALDARLGVLDGLGDHARLDGHLALEAHALHQRGDPVVGEALQQGVLEREEEARGAGSPWRPARPRSWLSMRRASWRSVPMMCRPPAATTLSWSGSHSALASASAWS